VLIQTSVQSKVQLPDLLPDSQRSDQHDDEAAAPEENVHSENEANKLPQN
jgi:hypothetical protein